MSEPSDGYRVGRGRPPRKTRWKKGQSGNPQYRKSRRAESTLDVIDRLLLRPIPLSLNGETRKDAALAAIVLQLLRKAISGDVRASRVLMGYKKFSTQNLEKKLELTFLESDYTRAFTSFGSDRDEE